jgi:hypothetical protein
MHRGARRPEPEREGERERNGRVEAAQNREPGAGD